MRRKNKKKKEEEEEKKGQLTERAPARMSMIHTTHTSAISKELRTIIRNDTASEKTTATGTSLTPQVVQQLLTSRLAVRSALHD